MFASNMRYVSWGRRTSNMVASSLAYRWSANVVSITRRPRWWARPHHSTTVSIDTHAQKVRSEYFCAILRATRTQMYFVFFCCWWGWRLVDDFWRCYVVSYSMQRYDRSFLCIYSTACVRARRSLSRNAANCSQTYTHKNSPTRLPTNATRCQRRHRRSAWLCVCCYVHETYMRFVYTGFSWKSSWTNAGIQHTHKHTDTKSNLLNRENENNVERYTDGKQRIDDGSTGVLSEIWLLLWIVYAFFFRKR